MDFVLKCHFIHLLPLSVYNKILFIFGENDSCIKELLNIKAAGLSIEHFESIIKESNGRIVDRILWFIRECNSNSVWFLFRLNLYKYNFFFLDLQMLLKAVFGCVQGR